MSGTILYNKFFENKMPILNDCVRSDFCLPLKLVSAL